MRIFDCDAAFGRGTTPIPRELETADDLLAEMDHCGIEQALVWHRDARERSFARGNARISELKGYSRLHRSCTIMPHTSREGFTEADLFEYLQVEDIRAVRAFPATHCYLLDPISCGDLLELLTAYRVPLFVSLAEIQDQWQGVYNLMRNFPHLTLVLTQTGCWGQDRYFRPLMRGFPRFFLSTNRFETAGQLKSLVNDLGFERLVFGSGLPFNNPGGYIMMIARADISDDAKQAIAFDNLAYMLGEVAW
ncbi:MAG: hypothetical protein U9Q79_12430 [Candidatus Hydrogenedentes bacterium]|nr:hypothetical protein [Candidatus Hydrogenedentota bacterium]